MRIFILLLTVFAPFAFAQEGGAKKTIRVAALDISKEHHTLWLRTGAGTAPVQVVLNTRAFSPPITYKGPALAAFYESAEAASAEEPPKPLATITLKTSSSLLVFSPKAKGAGYNAYLIAENQFPFGSFRLINLSKVVVGIDLDGKKSTLKPRKGETFAYQQAENDIPIRCYVPGADKKPRMIRQSSWSIVPDQRELVLFFPNSTNGLVKMRHFVDTKVEKAPIVE